jgi:hypothetical protein
MRRIVVLLVAGLLTAQAGVALAQYGVGNGGGVEILPFVGYRWGGSLNTVTGFREIKTQDNISYGIGFGMPTPKYSEVELAWTHYQGTVDFTLNSGVKGTGGTVKRDDILLSGTWYAYHNTSILPYFTAGLGAAIFSSQNASTVGRFTWDLGIGFRKDINDKVAMRLSGKWVPVWVTTGTGVWCDYYYCYSVGTGENYDQFEVGLNLIFKTGGH